MKKGKIKMINNINLDLFLELKKKYAYNWHPLAKHVSDVLFLYHSDFQIIEDVPRNNTFENKLKFVCERNSGYQYLKDIFKPLDIINYQDDNGNLFYLFKYKNYIELDKLGYDIAKFFELYDGLYLECRSVVFDNYGNLILAAMPKFKNYGEDSGKWSTANCRSTYTVCPMHYITDKMDGSYVQFTYNAYYQKIIGSTSKNLNPTNDDAGWRLKVAYEMLDENYKKMIETNSDYTFHFEFIHPNNPIVVHYPKEKQGLYLISARNNFTGSEIDFVNLTNIAKHFGVKTVKYYKEEDLTSILSKVGDYTSDEKEGWVINCIDKNWNNFRFKIKTDDYILMHKSLSKIISPNAIIQAIADDKWDDFYSKVPDSYKEQANNIFKEVINYYFNTNQVIENICKQIPNSFDRKNTAKWILENVPKFLRGYVFSVIDEKTFDVLKKANNGYLRLTEIRERSKVIENFLNSNKFQ